MTIRVAGRGFAQPQTKLLYNVALSAAGSFDVTGIPLGYNDLLLMLDGIRGDIAAVADILLLHFNGDTTATNYRSTRHEASVASHSVSETDTAAIATITGSTASANERSAMDIWIYGYSNSYNKVARVNNSERRAAAELRTQDFSLVWENVAAINQISIVTDNDPTDELLSGGRLRILLFR